MKKESDISNTVIPSASSSVIIESNEESSKPQSMKFKKRFFSSISYYKSSLNFDFNIKKYKPFSAKAKSFFSKNENSKTVSEFSILPKKEKKKILSTEELILEECKKYKFKALPINKSLFSHLRTNSKSVSKRYAKSMKIKHKSFTATPLPSFTTMEVKKSHRLLTIALSPKLHTKERSIRRQQSDKGALRRINSFKIEKV